MVLQGLQRLQVLQLQNMPSSATMSILLQVMQDPPIWKALRSCLLCNTLVLQVLQIIHVLHVIQVL